MAGTGPDKERERFRADGAEGASARHEQKLLDDLARIRKRLGSERHTAVASQLHTAFEEQRRTADVSAHREWIGALLGDYYDPMYDYQLDKREGECLFRGDRAAVVDWVRERAW